MGILLLAWSNLKKKKATTFSLGILIVLSIAFFQVGLTLLTEIEHFYERENDRLMGPHYIVRFSGNDYEERYLEFFQNDSRVMSANAQEVVIMDTAEFLEGGALSATFRNMDCENTLKGYEVVEQTSLSSDKNAVYLPTFLKDMGYELGGDFTIIFNKKTYSFFIAGFTQSTWLSSSVASLVDLYMPQTSFQKLYESVGSGYLLSMRVKNREELNSVIADFKEKTAIPLSAISMNAGIMAIPIEEMKSGSTMIVSLFSAVLLAFSLLMTGVVMIVIKFRINSHIESQMVHIGALQAMGYTGKQIKWSIVLEFMLIGLFSIPFGILCSRMIISGLGQLIVSSVGVSYQGRQDIWYGLISGLFMMAILLFFSLNAAGKAEKILPIQAFRHGMEAHNFQKNHFPLEKTNGPVFFLLGMKQVFFYKKTYIMTGVIFSAVSFACACAVILFFNMGLDDKLAIEMTGYEISDILITTAPHADYSTLSNQLREVDGIRKVAFSEAKSVSLDEDFLTCYVSDDFDTLETVSVYEGDFPRYNNEIVITGVLAKALGKTIGDQIVITGGSGAQLNYVICGLNQTMNNFGKQCMMNRTGYELIEPSYEPQSIQVYLDPGQEIDSMIQKLEAQFYVLSPTISSEKEEEISRARKTAEEKIANILLLYGADSAQYALLDDGEIILSGDTGNYSIKSISNNRRLFISNVNVISSSICLLTAVIVLAATLIIVLVFHMVIKTMLLRKRHEYGIFKAIGYADWELMQQVAVSFLPSSVCGTMLGLFGAYLSVNALTSLLFQKLGISKLELSVPIVMLTGLGVLIVLFSYGVSLLVARKMKTITVYELLREV